MYLSLNWLRDYLELPATLTPAELETIITTSIAEVESIRNIGQEGVVVGKVVKLEKHPNADKLKLVEVDTGDETHHVVCGGNNLREGMLIAFGKVGIQAKWHGEGDWITLEKAKIRGIESAGMILASEEVELPLPCPDGGITDLTDYATDADLDKNVFDLLKIRDVVLEIENKSLTHRPDLFGHYGLARDLYAVLKQQKELPLTLKPYPAPLPDQGNEELDIDIRTSGCRRFVAVKMTNVQIEPSPKWLQTRLMNVGVRPINNVVDITNYVMYDLGHPMHAFDAREISGKKMVIAQGKEGEEIIALDGKKYRLTAQDMVVYDGEKPSSIAGIMGGEGSGIHADTTEVIFEAASWDPIMIRKTAQRLSLRSEASTRFEKNLDPEQSVWAVYRAIALLKELCPTATTASKIYDTYKIHIPGAEIALRSNRVSQKLGTEIETATIQSILTDLGCTVSPSDDKTFTVEIPSWRSTKDLLNEDDLIEEVGRVYGYHRIPLTVPEGSLEPLISHEKNFERQTRFLLSHRLRWYEVMNYPFTNEKTQQEFGLDQNPLAIQNPISQEYTHLKTSMLPDLLSDAHKNIHEHDTFGLFELGRIYLPKAQEIQEQKKISGIVVRPRTDSSHPADRLFFGLKAALEEFFTYLDVAPRAYTSSEGYSFVEPGAAANIRIGGTDVGWIGEIKSDLAAKFDLEKHDVAAFELDQTLLLHHKQTGREYMPLPKFPPVIRDLAIIVDKTTPAASLEEKIRQAHPAVARVELFDIFEDPKLGENKRSLTYNITYLDPEKTLNDKDIQTITAKILESIATVGGKLRGE